MRILHVNDSMSWRGGEEQMCLLASGLQSNGIESTIALNPKSALEKEANIRNLNNTAIAMRSELDLPAAIRLRGYVIKNSISIVHTHTAHAHGVSALALSGLPRVKLLVHRRVDFHIKKRALSKWKYYGRPDAYIAISKAIKTILLEDGISEEIIKLVPSGIELSRFEDVPGRRDGIRRELGISSSELLCGNVAALAPHKAQWDLISAAKKVLRQCPEARFVIVGEGVLERRLRDQCRSMGLERSIIFTGFRNDIVNLLSAFDIFVLSSRTEGLGTSVLEAMAMGLPVAATSAGGIPEMVENGVNGLLSQPQDPSRLADNIIALCKNPQMRKSMSLAARKTANRFDVTSTVEQTVETYKWLSELGREHGKAVE